MKYFQIYTKNDFLKQMMRFPTDSFLRKSKMSIILSRIKCNFLKIQTKDNVDILMIFETKLNDRFRLGQFLITGYRTSYWPYQILLI